MKKRLFYAKRMLAIFLAAVTVVGSVPYTVYADDEGYTEEAPAPAEEAPAPVEEAAPAPAPAEDAAPAPAPVKEAAPAPAPVEEEAPAPVEEAAPAPASVEEAAPAPVEEAAPAPAPVEEAAPAPAPVEEAAPAPVEEAAPAPAPVEEAPAPVEEAAPAPAPAPVEEAPAPIEEAAPAPVEEIAPAPVEDKGTIGASEDKNAGGAGGTRTPAYNAGQVGVNVISYNTNVKNGSENDYKFNFSLNENPSMIYSAYVYGNGVDEALLKELAAAYFNATNNGGIGKDVVKQSLTDADKSSVNHNYNNGYDSELCWAYSASNALWQTDWIKKVNAGIFNNGDNASSYFTSEDDISSYAAYNLIDAGGDEIDFWTWFFTGYMREDKLLYGLDMDDSLLDEYYAGDLYTKHIVKDGDTLNNVLNIIEQGNKAATLGIYYLTGGGHAMGITGYIRDNTGKPVAVIVSDPDDGVRDTTVPDDPKLKNNVYSVYPISYGRPEGKEDYGWYLYPNLGYYARIGDITVLSDSDGKTKINQSTRPTVLRAIADYFDNNIEYEFDNNYNLNIPLNFDFLSYYDVSTLKYRLISDTENVIAETVLSRSKNEWKEMIANGAVSVSLYFEEYLKDLSDGKYKVEVEIDKDCFLGNYGWFANRYNNTADHEGYFDKLVSVWVKLFRGDKSGPSASEGELPLGYPEETERESGDKGSAANNSPYVTDLDQAIENAILEAFLDEIVSEIHMNYASIAADGLGEVTVIADGNEVDSAIVLKAEDAEVVKATVKAVVNDLLKAVANDKTAVDAFKSIGIEIKQEDIKDLDVVMSTSVKMTKAGKVTFKSKNTKYSQNDQVFAVIRLADGTIRYIRVKVLEDGSIEVELPENTTSVTVLALNK